jgi:hypothetical protein
MMMQFNTGRKRCDANLFRGVQAALLADFLLLGLSGAPGQAGALRVPIPEPKPQLAASVPLGKPAVLKDLPHHGIVSLAAIPSAEYDTCVQALEASGVEFERPFHVSEEGCTLDGAVSLLSVPTPAGRVSFPGHPKMLCPFAAKFSRWLNEVGAPIIAQRLGSPLASIQTGSGFVCRNRVGGSMAKISEHARGNALDLMRFDLKNKQHVTVEQMPAGSYATALSGLRSSACGYFTTVLGPGSNAAHKNHLHFDLGKHGKSETYRICE